MREAITALHLPLSKLHGLPAGRHTTVVHPNKHYHAVRGWPNRSAEAEVALRQSERPAMLPLKLTIRPPPALGAHVTWRAQELDVVRTFLRAHHDDGALCGENGVPCARAKWAV